ncbi:MAG: zinc dependent phospholipase C family protein [Dehalococcoidia bacterium]
MPNLPMHIYVAQQVARELDWGFVHDHLGSCFLGSTTPDIRAMTKWDRERTHFAPLSVEQVGTGTRRMFELYPELADHRNLSPATQSFVLGYVSHLTADEVWITTMYRPHFSSRERITTTEVEAHIWDRALQLDMDRKVSEGSDGFSRISPYIDDAEQGVSVAFLEDELLTEWRAWVARFLSWDFDWERLKRALNRMFRDNDDVQQVVDRFLQDMPQSLDRVYDKIPPEKMLGYEQQVLQETLAQVREYLGGA